MTKEEYERKLKLFTELVENAKGWDSPFVQLEHFGYLTINGVPKEERELFKQEMLEFFQTKIDKLKEETYEEYSP